MVKPKLIFYNQPFRLDVYGHWVYDGKNNFCFQFKCQKYTEEKEKIMIQIVSCLNAVPNRPLESIKLIQNEDPIYINIKGIEDLYILIRGWGNLTGLGARNFHPEKAAQIQKDFIKWLIYKVNK